MMGAYYSRLKVLLFEARDPPPTPIDTDTVNTVQHRLQMLMNPIKKHQTGGYGVWMKTWSCTHSCSYVISTERNHMFLQPQNHLVLVFPLGKFECGCCHSTTGLHLAHWSNDDGYMSCDDCRRKKVLSKRQLPQGNFYHVFTILDDINSWKDLVDIHPIFQKDIEYEDVRGMNNPFRKELNEKAAMMATTLGMTYMDGKSTRELYHEMLAKRVLRRFRKNRVKKQRGKLAWVLYMRGQMGRLAALEMAERCYGLK